MLVDIPCMVRDFSEISGIKSNVIIAKLFMAGIMANIDSNLDRDTIELLAQEFGKEVTLREQATVDKPRRIEADPTLVKHLKGNL